MRCSRRDGRAPACGSWQARPHYSGCAAAALAPSHALFAVALFVLGSAALTFTAATTAPSMRGRVLAIRLAIALGCTPLVGLVADHLGPRWALGIGAAAGFAAALVALWHLAGEHAGSLFHCPHEEAMPP